MRRESAVSYWLLPCKPDAARYKQTIERLTSENDTKAFEPHLTLGTLHAVIPDLTSTFATLKTMTLRPIEIGATAVFTTSLFVRFSPTRDLLNARTEFERLPGFRKGRMFDPHISLHYGPPPKVSMQWPEVRALLDRPVLFDRLVAVAVELPITRADHLDSWVELETLELSTS
ncbi:MAG: hypothetical protein AAFP81_05280 [Pseudomonadota bacterium]